MEDNNADTLKCFMHFCSVLAKYQEYFQTPETQEFLISWFIRYFYFLILESYHSIDVFICRNIRLFISLSVHGFFINLTSVENTKNK